jgi:hypothetical protein
VVWRATAWFVPASRHAVLGRRASPGRATLTSALPALRLTSRLLLRADRHGNRHRGLPTTAAGGSGRGAAAAAAAARPLFLITISPVSLGVWGFRPTDAILQHPAPGPGSGPSPDRDALLGDTGIFPVPSGTPPHGNGRAIRAPGRRGRRAANQSSSAPLVFDADVARGTTRPPCTRGLGGRVLFFAVTRGLDSAGCLRRLRLATAAAADDDPRRVEQRSANLARRHPRGRQMTFDV